MAPKPPKKAKGSGHSYVNKDKGAAKAQSNKRTVATWLWGEPDADLSSALSQLAPLQLWKEFAATLGRAWSAHGQDPTLGHWLLHAEAAVVKDLWRIYSEGPPGEQEYELGTHVRVLFEDGLWYLGAVTNFDERSSKYTVVFEDGDQLDMRIPDKDVEVLTPDEREEAERKRAQESELQGRTEERGNEDEGILLGSNAYRFQKPKPLVADHAHEPKDPSAWDDSEAQRQSEHEEGERAAAEQKRQELAAKVKSSFVATAFRLPTAKRAKKDELKKKMRLKLGRASATDKSGKQGMQKKYKMKNKSFR